MSSARLAHYLRSSNHIRTYRVVFSDLTSTAAGALFELSGAANRNVKLRHIQISKPNVVLEPYTLERYSTLTSGGTQTSTSTIRISHPNGSTSLSEARLFTVVPTLGTLVGLLQEIDFAVTDVLNEHYGDEDGSNAPTLEDSTHAFVLRGSAGVVLNGYVEWTEEGPST